ncbi:MAG: hypothetical protein ABI867_40800 [Kofleriaceae bacterium]
MTRFLVLVLALTVTTPALAAPAPAVISMELDQSQLGSGMFFGAALPISAPEPGGFLVTADADPSWFVLGLKPGDVIETENGRPVGERLGIGSGRTVLGISRKGKPVLLYLTIHGDASETGTLDEQDMLKLQAASLPFSQPVTDKHGPTGVRITDVIVALYAKLSVGDLVRTVGGVSIHSDLELAAALRGLKLGATEIVVERLGRKVVVTLTREAPIDLTTIKRTGPTSFVVPRAIIDALGNDPWMVIRKAKLVPAGSKGKLHGYKLYDVEPGSLYAAIGLGTEDVILDIDGHSIDSRDQAFAVMHKLDKAPKITLHVVHRGERLAMTYSIR